MKGQFLTNIKIYNKDNRFFSFDYFPFKSVKENYLFDLKNGFSPYAQTKFQERLYRNFAKYLDLRVIDFTIYPIKNNFFNQFDMIVAVLKKGGKSVQIYGVII